MTLPQQITVAIIVGSLFALALFAEPPAWMHRLFGRLVDAIEAFARWFRRGRHHVHAPLLARPFERERLTVDQLRARIQRDRPVGSAYLTIETDIRRWSAENLHALTAIVE